MPLTVSWKDDAPTEVEAGKMLVMERPGAVMVKMAAFEVLAPSCAVTVAVPC